MDRHCGVGLLAVLLFGKTGSAEELICSSLCEDRLCGIDWFATPLSGT